MHKFCGVSLLDLKEFMAETSHSVLEIYAQMRGIIHLCKISARLDGNHCRYLIIFVKKRFAIYANL